MELCTAVIRDPGAEAHDAFAQQGSPSPGNPRHRAGIRRGSHACNDGRRSRSIIGQGAGDRPLRGLRRFGWLRCNPAGMRGGVPGAVVRNRSAPLAVHRSVRGRRSSLPPAGQDRLPVTARLPLNATPARWPASRTRSKPPQSGQLTHTVGGKNPRSQR